MNILDALMPQVRHELLTEFFLDTGREWYPSELARQMDVRASTLQRELMSLSNAGILRLRRDGNRVYYSADETCPIFPELRSIIDKTDGVQPTIWAALKPVHNCISAAFVFGSFARQEENNSSDIDLLIVGKISAFQLSALLREPETSLRRSINVVTYSDHEFMQGISQGNHFLTSVVESPKLFLKGSEDELARFAERATSSAVCNE